MVNEFEILKDILNKLNAASINYMLSGSFAMNYYSQPRMTRDKASLGKRKQIRITVK